MTTSLRLTFFGGGRGVQITTLHIPKTHHIEMAHDLTSVPNDGLRLIRTQSNRRAHVMRADGARLEDFVRCTRAWKLFFLLPWMLLFSREEYFGPNWRKSSDNFSLAIGLHCRWRQGPGTEKTPRDKKTETGEATCCRDKIKNWLTGQKKQEPKPRKASGKGPRRVGPPKGGGGGGGGPKISLFFPSPPQYSFFYLSFGVLSLNFGGVLEAGTLKCARLEFSGCRVRTPAARSGGAAGVQHNNQRTPHAHI